MKNPYIHFLGVVLVTTGCALPPAAPIRPPTTPEYHIAPPDQLEITVRPEPAITRSVVVRPDGHISFDLVGDVEVAGKTIREVQAEITQRISRFIVHPDVAVNLAASRSRQIFVLGEIRNPGAYPILGTTSVIDAFGKAGGSTRFSKLSTARLLRPTEGEPLAFHVNLEAIARSGDGQTNYELEPGDILFVPPNAWARVGYAIGVVFFPLQQVLGLGGLGGRNAVSVHTGGAL